MYMPHTTAALTITENADPNVARDILSWLARPVPVTGDFKHAEGNSDAHIKASLVGFSVTVPVIDGRLALSTWQFTPSASSMVPGTGMCWLVLQAGRSRDVVF